MLLSSLLYAFRLFPGDSEHVLDPTVFLAPKPTAVPFTPEEPTTLTLALIGLAIVACYAYITQRRRRAMRAANEFASPRPDAGARHEKPKRSAA
jgi:hypothetical protein